MKKNKTHYISALLITIANAFAFSGFATDTTLPIDSSYHLLKDGVFPIYQKKDHYFLKLKDSILGKDILILGDCNATAGIFAASSGFYRFYKNDNNGNIAVKKILPVDTTIGNIDIPELNNVTQSNLLPTTMILEVTPAGKEKDGSMIDITEMLMSGNKLFSFSNYSLLNNADRNLSQLQNIQNNTNGITFSIYRSQLNTLREHTPRVSAYNVQLGIFVLDNNDYKMRFADKRIGYQTVSLIDFAKDKYYAHSVKIIQKWGFRFSPKDSVSYLKGNAVKPQNAIVVDIDANTPSFYTKYIQNAIQAWNRAFESAGIKDALLPVITKKPIVQPGHIIVRWGNAYGGRMPLAVLSNPNTGQIYAAKVNLTTSLATSLMPYFAAQCGLVDKQAFDEQYISLKGSIIQYLLSKGLAQIFGLENNYAASSAYTMEDIANKNWVKKNGFTSSITDAIDFNYGASGSESWPLDLLIPSVGTYDKLAIRFGYGFGPKKVVENDFLLKKQRNPVYIYSDTAQNNTLGLFYDLSSNRVAMASKGIDNLIKLYPQFDSFYCSVNKSKEDWTSYTEYSNAFFNLYQRYIGVFTYEIGGNINFPLEKTTDLPLFCSNSVRSQKEALASLGKYLFTNSPAWLVNNTRFKIEGNNINNMTAPLLDRTFDKLLSPETFNNILANPDKDTEGHLWNLDNYLQSLNYWVFNNFDTSMVISEYKKWVSAIFINRLIQIANNNKLVSGLNSYNVALYKYAQDVFIKVKYLSTHHKDKNTAENYTFLTILINNNYQS